jgi:hypothetical protein
MTTFSKNSKNRDFNCNKSALLTSIYKEGGSENWENQGQPSVNDLKK